MSKTKTIKVQRRELLGEETGEYSYTDEFGVFHEDKRKVWSKEYSRSEMTYDEVCHDLGFIPSVHFVEITTAGTIDFTAGTWEDIKALWDAVIDKGYRPSHAFDEYINKRRGYPSYFGK